MAGGKDRGGHVQVPDQVWPWDIHVIHTYLLSTYYKPATILGDEDLQWEKKTEIPLSYRAYILEGKPKDTRKEWLLKKKRKWNKSKGGDRGEGGYLPQVG